MLQRQYEEKITFTVLGHFFRKLFFPAPLQILWTAVQSVRFIWDGIKCLARGKLEVPVLDASAITASMLRGDFGTASSVMFLLRIGEILEEWTHKKSVGDLARTMSLKADKVWLRTSDGASDDVLVPIQEVGVGDRIVVRTSNVIPLDGVVDSGEMTVNQSSMTGESVPVPKAAGSPVFTGTVGEEGLSSGRQAGSLESGRDAYYVAADPQYFPGAVISHGRFLVCSEAFHAAHGAFHHPRSR